MQTNPFYPTGIPTLPIQQSLPPFPGQAAQAIKVNGLESAKAYPMQPNSEVALFDLNDDVFYWKTTDASNFPSIRRYRFYEEPEEVVNEQKNAEYVTMEEFNKFKKEVLDAQQSLREQSTKSKWNGNEFAADKGTYGPGEE